MSNQTSKQRIQVPDSLRDLLLEFSIAYLLEQPGDVIDYAVEFFTKLQENRRSSIGIGDGNGQDDGPASPDDESIMSVDEGKCHGSIHLQFDMLFPVVIVVIVVTFHRLGTDSPLALSFMRNDDDMNGK